MNNPKTFSDFLAAAQTSVEYWTELAILEFTENVFRQMSEQNTSKAKLARLLGVGPAFITRILNGNHNFTLATMVKIARALDCEFRSELQPKGVTTHFINVLHVKPEQPKMFNSSNFKSIESYERVAAA